MKSGSDYSTKVMTDLEAVVNIEKVPDGQKKESDTSVYISTLEELNSRLTIERPVFKQHISDKCSEDTNALLDSSCFNCHCRPKKCLKKTFPAISWFNSYRWKDWLIKDIIAGFTVAVMNIPQGMAYAMLGNVPPVVGIYMAFFPVLVYIFLGTSRHVSMGSFAVICLMAGNVVSKHASDQTDFIQNSGVNITQTNYSPIEVATAVTFLVGLYQIIMYFFRLGIICTLLSETLVSGFTAGAAIHVLTSQIKDLLGLKLKQINGPFKLIFVYIEIFSKIGTANTAAIVISLITIIVLVTNNQVLKPFVEKRIPIPIPIELIVVLVGTLVSTYCNIPEIYHLKTVGEIAVGLPNPMVPKFELMPKIAVDSGIIALIAYIVSLSMALIFANKLKYEVDANQELLAQGSGNIVGSFFSCLPFSASLSRSVLQQSVGGVTQMASLVSCGILVAVLLWIGPFFEPLPRCILASLIVVALKGILFQAKDIIDIWSVSRSDALIWLCTYITVICVEIEYGLLVGVVISILTVIIKGAQGDMSLLGQIPNTEIYLDPNTEPKAEFIPGIIIIRYCGSLNFINKAYFEKQILKNTRWDTPTAHYGIHNKVNPGVEVTKEIIILDLRSMQYIDSSGGRTLKKLINIISENRLIYLVGLSDTAIKMLNSLKVLQEMTVVFMPTIHDAVITAQYKNKDFLFSVQL